jgi:Histidine kinase-, DNA gyrase B-, and HSP90-like ATPase
MKPEIIPSKSAAPAVLDAEHPYAMTISLNVLNHLGINLYSNMPAVLSEMVANSWDADAAHVAVEIRTDQNEIVITDDGHGMNRDDVNDRFLLVGYARRDEPGGGRSPERDRVVMGRKGLGKLSVFSIAKVAEIYTIRDGIKSAFRLDVDDIKREIEAKGGAGTYYPQPLDESLVDLPRGTRLVIKSPKKELHQVAGNLRRRLARRFSILGQEYDFEVTIDGVPITVEDRDYFHKIEYLWYFGDEAAKYVTYSKNAKKSMVRSSDTPKGQSIGGWIGSVQKPKELREPEDNLNRIVLMVRGKVAQEDVLAEFNDGGLYTKYLLGEIHADFLDRDELDDIATSSRQKIIEDDPRYEDLKDFVYKQLKTVENTWSELRNETGTKQALEIVAIKNWFESLGTSQRKYAESLFGRINQMTVEDKAKRELFKHGVLAFESLRQKDALEALEKISPNDLQGLTDVFATLDDIEAALYHQIVTERVEVIEKLRSVVEENALEKVVQEHLYKHLWLLDPAWERATETAYLEQSVQKAFDKIDANLNKEERDGRVDIRYVKASGEHVIVELKRADRVVTSAGVIDQVDKYRSALQKILDQQNRGHESIEVVVLVGKELKDWAQKHGRQESTETLRPKHIRVVMYQELLDNAYKAYRGFIDKKEEVGRLSMLIRDIEKEIGQ